MTVSAGKASEQAKDDPAASKEVSEFSGNVGVSSDFSASVFLGGLELRVMREGKHANLHLIDQEERPFWWTFEPLEQAIPKLEALLSAAKLAQEAA